MVSRDFNNINDIRKTQMLLTSESDPARIADALNGRNSAWNPNVKTALLIAQAAERTYQLAMSAGIYAQKHDGCVEQYKRINKGRPRSQWELLSEKPVEYNDAVFKAVGAEGDPETLKAAQATWMATQIYMNLEVNTINNEVKSSGYMGQQHSMGPEYADGFKKSAAGFYLLAAEMLGKEGLADAAAKLGATGRAIMKYGVDNQNAPPPSQFLSDHLNQEKSDVENDNWAMRFDAPEGRWHLDTKYVETLERLIKLTTPPPAALKKNLKPGA